MCGFGAWQPMSSFTFIIWKRATSTFYKISSFLFYRIKKSTQVCNSMRVSTWWPNLHFWVNYSFKMPQNVQYWVLQQPVLEVPHSITTQYSLWVSEYQHCIREWSWCIQESDAHAHTHFPPFFCSAVFTQITTSITSINTDPTCSNQWETETKVHFLCKNQSHGR